MGLVVRLFRSGEFSSLPILPFIHSLFPRCRQLIQPLPALATRRQRPVQPVAGIVRAVPTAFHAVTNGALANGTTRAHHAGQLHHAAASPAAHLFRLQRPFRRGISLRQEALLLRIAGGAIHRAALAVVAAVRPVHVSSPLPATATPARRTDPESRSARTSLRARDQTHTPPP